MGVACRLQRNERDLARQLRLQGFPSCHPRQYLVSNYHGPWLHGYHRRVVFDGLLLVLFLRIWQPTQFGDTMDRMTSSAPLPWYPRLLPRRGCAGVVAVVGFDCLSLLLGHLHREEDHEHARKGVFPFMSTCGILLPARSRTSSDPGQRTQQNGAACSTPLFLKTDGRGCLIFGLNWISATGSGILAAAIISGFHHGPLITEDGSSCGGRQFETCALLR